MCSINKRIGNFEFRASTPLGKWDSSDLYYEVIKYYPNIYYGKESEYDYNEEEKCYTYKDHPECRIDPGCFKRKESAYTVAVYVYDESENDYDLKSIGERIVTSAKNSEDIMNLHNIIKYGFNVLASLNNEEE